MTLGEQHIVDSMDDLLNKNALKLKANLQQGNTTAYWTLWNSIIEHAFCDLFVLDSQRSRYTGRGSSNVKRQRRDKPVKLNTDNANTTGVEMSLCDKNLAKLRKQHLRCLQLSARLSKISKLGAACDNFIPDHVQATHAQLNAEAVRCIRKDLDLTNAFETEMPTKSNNKLIAPLLTRWLN